MSVRAEVRVRAPAKVNLQLSVGAAEPDGYHRLATVFQSVAVYEDVIATPADDITVSITGEGEGKVGLGPDNLAHRAATLVRRVGSVDAGVHLHLRKGVPVAAGLAGGSADAAATIVACDALWDLGLSRDRMRELAAQLGADVPFALLGGVAVGTGRGDQLTPALHRGTLHWVLAVADHGLSTPAVYAELDRQRGGSPVPEPRVADGLMQALLAGDPAAVAAHLDNDLQAAAFALDDTLQPVLELGLDEGALGGIVSGSGPTVAFLVGGDEAAMDLSVALTASGRVRDVKRAHGPVPGARLVESVSTHPSFGHF